MQDHPVSRFPVPSVDELPDDIRLRIASVQENFIPNVFLTLAHRPDEFRAFFAYFDALMLKDSGLTKTEREMIVVAIEANRLYGCSLSSQHFLIVLPQSRLRPQREGLEACEGL